MPGRASKKARLQLAATYVALTLLATFALAPLIWGALTSLKPEGLLHAYPPVWIPTELTFDHYKRVFTGSNMPRYFGNSVLVLIGTVLLCIVVASHAAYVTERIRFRGRQVVLFLILCTIMVPGIAVLVPLYSLARNVQLQDTLLALILIYAAWLTPTCLWIMQGFFAAIPRSLDEAAMIDGCSRLQLFYLIILPLAAPGIISLTLVVFRFTWNEFIIALTISASDSTRTIPIGLYYFISAFGIEWGVLMAAVVVALLPAALLFVLLQRRFVEGLMAGSVKG